MRKLISATILHLKDWHKGDYSENITSHTDIINYLNEHTHQTTDDKKYHFILSFTFKKSYTKQIWEPAWK